MARKRTGTILLSFHPEEKSEPKLDVHSLYENDDLAVVSLTVCDVEAKWFVNARQCKMIAAAFTQARKEILDDARRAKAKGARILRRNQRGGE